MASPFTYEEMKARQKAVGPAGPAGPIMPEIVPEVSTDTTTVSEDVLNTPALDDSVETPAPPAPAPAHKGPLTFDENRAKRAVVLNALRNTTGGAEQFARHIRRAYGVSKNFKASAEEILGAGFRMQQKTIPDLTPEEYIRAMTKLYGGRVDKSLLEQARIDYPGHTDEKKLIDEMYKRKIAKEETATLTFADMAQILARRFPQLHRSNVEPENGLRMIYDAQKAKGKDVGSFDDWLHTQMAPTLAERGASVAGGFLRAIIEQAKSVGTLATEVATPGRLASDVATATQAGESPAGEEAKARLKEAGMGAVNVAALAAAPAAKAGLTALEAAAGAARTAPALVGAAEGLAAGGVQAGGQSAIEGGTPAEIAQAAATGAGLAGAIGAGVGGLAGRAVARKAAKEAAEAEAEAAAAAMAGSADLPPQTPETPVTLTTDPLELAARHNAESRWQAAISDFARKHGMDREDAARLVANEEPNLTDLAAAQSRFGVTAEEIAELRQALPDHMRTTPLEPPTAIAPETQGNELLEGPLRALAISGTPEEQAALRAAMGKPMGAPAEGFAKTAPPAAPAAPTAPKPPAEPGVIQSPVSERMTSALNRAQAQLAERRRLRREELSARLARAREAYGAVGGGLAGLRAKLSAMAGEIKKPDWEGVADEFRDIDLGTLHDAIARAPMLEGDKLTAHSGLTRLFNGTKMGAPTLSQIRALRTAFGSEFAEAAIRNRTAMQNFFQTGMRILNTPRSLMTSLDLSAGMRQGYLMTSRPEYWRAWNSMRKAFGDEAVEDAVIADIKANPKYGIMRENGLFFQGDKMAGERSEVFAGSLVDRWAGVKQSQRAYDTFINKLRADVFSNVYDEMASAGVSVTDPQFRQSLAHWINTATGRGSMALLGRDAGLLNALAFSPRLAWSRFETFNPMYYKGLHPAVRVAAMKANVKTVSATMALLGLMAGSGLATVAWDPRQSDFAKLKFGNTRLDILGGHQQLARLFAQMITGKVISSTTGREVDLNGSDAKNGWSRQGMTRLDVLGRFFEAKASPLASLAVTMLRGRDFLGKPISVPNEILTRFTPMPISDVAEAVKESGWSAGLLAAPAAVVGLGVQSYGPTLPASAGGDTKPQEGIAMQTVNMGQRLWNHLNGIAVDREMRFVTPELAEQWVRDAAMAQVVAQQDATREKGFFDAGFDQKSAIRKATARRMARINRLYKDLAGGNGEQARLAAEKAMLQRRAEATGIDPEALSNPEVYSEVTNDYPR